MVNWKTKYLKYKLKLEKMNSKNKQKGGSIGHYAAEGNMTEFWRPMAEQWLSTLNMEYRIPWPIVTEDLPDIRYVETNPMVKQKVIDSLNEYKVPEELGIWKLEILTHLQLIKGTIWDILANDNDWLNTSVGKNDFDTYGVIPGQMIGYKGAFVKELPATHYGVYLGFGNIFEVGSDSGSPIESQIFVQRRGISTLESFIRRSFDYRDQTAFKLHNELDSNKNNILLRIDRAIELVESDPQQFFGIFISNCESVAQYIYSGRAVSNQGVVLTVGIFTTLTLALADKVFTGMVGTPGEGEGSFKNFKTLQGYFTKGVAIDKNNNDLEDRWCPCDKYKRYLNRCIVSENKYGKECLEGIDDDLFFNKGVWATSYLPYSQNTKPYVYGDDTKYETRYFDETSQKWLTLSEVLELQ